jgi:hypothetical protein
MSHSDKRNMIEERLYSFSEIYLKRKKKYMELLLKYKIKLDKKVSDKNLFVYILQLCDI